MSTQTRLRGDLRPDDAAAKKTPCEQTMAALIQESFEQQLCQRQMRSSAAVLDASCTGSPVKTRGTESLRCSHIRLLALHCSLLSTDVKPCRVFLCTLARHAEAHHAQHRLCSGKEAVAHRTSSAVQLTAYQAIYANGSTASNLPPGIQFTVHSAPAPGPGGEASHSSALHVACIIPASALGDMLWHQWHARPGHQSFPLPCLPYNHALARSSGGSY